ncbi:GTPase HflX [Mycobacterium sp. URHB0044]|jgi:GTP-binding protein HflX|uniref:GTPase HflX n=1 Tax=Mycobacterium sp. URHB0044 TaxID=1380386 RepID=UPI00048A86EB|nr:GTPase HflX [Mycobacterium sp. URHB0044]
MTEYDDRYTAPSLGELALEDRTALRRVAGLSTELTDVSEVEYRQLRLERVVLVGVWTEGSAADVEASMAELAALAETAGSEVLEALIQRRDKPDASTYIGSGKAAELRDIVAATGADTVICDGELSPAQLNALEKAVKVKVVDRTALILDIFAQHATSREGKAQVAYAQMEYMLPRLRGWGESMSRQGGGAGGSSGGVGTRGPGETKIETDRRRIRERMSKLRREIKDMKKIRDTQRGRRLQSDLASVAIVGYTNAGKSSLLNALTGAGVLVENALFATLEPTTRRGEFDDGRPFVLTDTVGFVRHLPTQLVEAFRSTLEEVVDAQLLVHVVDGSDATPLAQIDAVRQVVNEVIREYDIAPPPELLVVNKTDAATGLGLAQLRRALPDAVFVSARTGDGIDRLRSRMSELVPPTDVTVDVTLPYDRGDLVARMHAEGRIDATEHTDDGTRIKARVPVALAAGLREFATF